MFQTSPKGSAPKPRTSVRGTGFTHFNCFLAENWHLVVDGIVNEELDRCTVVLRLGCGLPAACRLEGLPHQESKADRREGLAQLCGAQGGLGEHAVDGPIVD